MEDEKGGRLITEGFISFPFRLLEFSGEGKYVLEGITKTNIEIPYDALPAFAQFLLQMQVWVVSTLGRLVEAQQHYQNFKISKEAGRLLGENDD